jgi:hypothetical protein
MVGAGISIERIEEGDSSESISIPVATLMKANIFRLSE